MRSPAVRAPDRRSVRTRAALRDALLTLMTERDWEDISVQDVCAHADIARSTFYLHYASKDALLQGGFRDLQAQLQGAAGGPRRGRVRAEEWSGFRFGPGLIDHIYDNRALFRRMIGRRSGFAVQQRFREMVLRLIDHELPTPDGDLPRAAVVRQLAAALAELVAWSVEQRTPMAPEQLAAAFDRIAIAVARRAQPLGPLP